MESQKIKEILLNTKYFIDNEWLNKYCELIENNRNTKKEKYKTQKHHIIPKCYYNMNKIEIDNSKENLVNLLYKDHILAHYYLCLCTEGNFHYKLANAFFHLTYRKWKYENFDPTQLYNYNKMYENWCKNTSKIMKGKKISEETRKKMSKPRSEEFKNHLSLILKGRSKPNLSKILKGRPKPEVSLALKGKPKPWVSENLKGKENKRNQKYHNIYCLELDEMFESTFEIKNKYPKLDLNTVTKKLQQGLENARNIKKTSLHWCYGFKNKEESKYHLIKFLKSCSTANSKPIQNLETGEVYKSAINASLKITGKESSNISESAWYFDKGKNKIAYGSHWVYLKDINKPYNEKERKLLLDNLPLPYSQKMKKIQNLDTGKVYNNLQEIKKELNLKDTSGFHRGCKCIVEGYDSKMHGYHWIYINDRDTPYTQEECKEILKNLKPFIRYNSKKVLNLDTNEIFNSAAEADIKYSKKHKQTSAVLGACNRYKTGNSNVAHGYHWKFVD